MSPPHTPQILAPQIFLHVSHTEIVEIVLQSCVFSSASGREKIMARFTWHSAEHTPDWYRLWCLPLICTVQWSPATTTCSRRRRKGRQTLGSYSSSWAAHYLKMGAASAAKFSRELICPIVFQSRRFYKRRADVVFAIHIYSRFTSMELYQWSVAPLVLKSAKNRQGEREWGGERRREWVGGRNFTT
jgi:hypothetical protein